MKNEERKQAEQLFRATPKLLESDTFSENEKEPFKKVNAMLAGYLMSSWLPRGWLRKGIMLLLFIGSIWGALSISWWFLLILLLILPFSPRGIVKVAVLLGSLNKK